MGTYKNVNRGLIPAIIVISENTVGTVTTFVFNNLPRREVAYFAGLFVAKFPNAVTATTTNTVQFETQGISNSTVPVYGTSGAPITIADLTSTDQAVHLFFYDSDNNRVQLMV
uniref:Capsid protein n=1 Tax=Geladintestivirus 1 TaxID=3233133 RepID=A0AAU8MJL5_9CAUD